MVNAKGIHAESLGLNHLLTKDHLEDVDETGKTDGQALCYEAASQKWKPKTVSGGSASFEDIWFADLYKTILVPNVDEDVIAKSLASVCDCTAQIWHISNSGGASDYGMYTQPIGYTGINFPNNLFNASPEFEIAFLGDNFAAGLTIYIILIAGSFATANKKFGLKIVGTTAYIVSADGTTESTTSLATGLVSGTVYRVRFKLVSGTIYAYWNGSSTATTKTTNVPSGSVGATVLNFIIRDSGAVENGLYVFAAPFSCGFV